MRLAVLVLLASVSVAQAQTVSADSSRGSSRADAARADSVAAEAVGVPDPLTGEVPTEAPPPYRSLDARAARALYRFDPPAFAAVMHVANEASIPAFALAAPVSGGIALVRGSSLRPAVRLGASEAGVTAAVLALKNVFRRPRPYRAMEEITARDRRYGTAPVDPFSFPSGHAAISFAVATSVALSDARLAAPAYAWAVATSASRVWHGVHYPSDVLAGAAIGVGVAGVVHVLLPSGSDDEAPVVPFAITVPF